MEDQSIQEEVSICKRRWRAFALLSFLGGFNMNCQIPDKYKEFSREVLVKKKKDRESLIKKMNELMEEVAYFSDIEFIKINLPYESLSNSDIVNIAAYLSTKIKSFTDESVEFYLSDYYDYIQKLLKNFNPVFKYGIDKMIAHDYTEIEVKVGAALDKFDKKVILSYLAKLGYNHKLVTITDTLITIPISLKG